MIVKILGAIDLVSALAFLMLIFGMNVFPPFLIFCGALLLIKGMFIFTGDVLSFVDMFAAVLLLSSLIINLFPILLWIPAFLLIAKGLVSFL